MRTANSFKCDISVNKDGNVIDGKSILGLLMLAAGQGAALTITARGEDAELALEALERLIVEKFGEE